MTAERDHATTAVDGATSARQAPCARSCSIRRGSRRPPSLPRSATSRRRRWPSCLVSDLANGLVIRDRFGMPAAWHYALTPAGQAALEHPNYLRRQAHRAANKRRPQLHLLVETNHA